MPNVHEKFNSPDADVIIQSSDGVQFHLHRKNLESNTGAFPGAEFKTSKEPVQLTEPATVLEVIFQFVYPTRHPILEDREFDSLYAVAEAVEKYEVFPAMNTCMYALKQAKHVQDHSSEILSHALKHNYPELVDMMAPNLLFSDPITTAKKLPVLYSFPWMEYYQACLIIIFKDAEDYSTKLLVTTGQCYKATAPHATRNSQICDLCLVNFFKWLWRLREAILASRLTQKLDDFSFYQSTQDHCSNCSSTGSIPRRCVHVDEAMSRCEKSFSKIPPFSQFLSGNRN